jgi:hypothetical protein
MVSYLSNFFRIKNSWTSGIDFGAMATGKRDAGFNEKPGAVLACGNIRDSEEVIK